MPASTANTEQPVVCSCGKTIKPYVIGEKSFTPAFCPDCITEQERLETEPLPIVSLPRYAKAGFDNLHDPKPPEHVIETCRLFAITFKKDKTMQGQGLYLFGPNGTGKTHLAVAIARTVGSALFINTLSLFDELKDCYTRDEICRPYQEARTTQLLILDDLGAERPSSWVRERLYRLVNFRWDHMLSTVYTSNIPPTELPDRIGVRASSRITGSCLIGHVDGPDHRSFSSTRI